MGISFLQNHAEIIQTAFCSIVRHLLSVLCMNLRQIDCHNNLRLASRAAFKDRVWMTPATPLFWEYSTSKN